MFVVIIVFLYAGIQVLELTAVLARASGIHSGDHLLGYSVQQSIYMGTRLLLVFLMPLLGYVTDVGMELNTYKIMVHLSLVLSSAFGMIVFLNRKKIMNYYLRVMHNYKKTGQFAKSFFTSMVTKGGNEVKLTKFSVKELIEEPDAKRIFIFSAIVFSVYSIGVFMAFFFAIKFNEYRSSISQLSGILNAFGAVLLTFIVEPLISRRIDEKHKAAELLITSLFLGRLFALSVFGQVIVSIVFYWGV